MSKGGKLTIESLSNGFYLANQRIEGGTHPVPDPKWADLLEAMLFIQQQTHALLKCPENVNNEQAAAVFATRDIIRTGRAQVVAEPWETRPLSQEEAGKLYAQLGNGISMELIVHYDQNLEMDIFGTKLQLGPTVYSCKSAYMTEKDAEALRRAIDTASEDIDFIARITPSPGYLFDVACLEWLPIKEKAAILRSPTFRVPTLQNAARFLWASTKEADDINIGAFVDALAEACEYNPNQKECDETLLNPFSNTTEDELQIALAPVFDELGDEAKVELGLTINDAKLLSLQRVSELINTPIDNLELARANARLHAV